jgi:small subunit ribosomal protein S9
MSEEATPTATETPAAPAATLIEAPVEEQVRPLGEPAKPDRGGFIWGTGRRKSAVARVRLKPGDGKFLVNKRDVNEFFSEPQHKAACHKPLEVTDTLGKLDVYVNCHGGGIMGQAEAILLGVARALKGYDPTLEATLRGNNLLTRDPREVERKKPGQPGARKRFQFSKR